MTTAPNITSVLSVRVNPDERAILEAAAEQAHTSLSDFVRRKALEAAEMDVFNRSSWRADVPPGKADTRWLRPL
jgi:uncharacterized protein (DUF1778 family)